MYRFATRLVNHVTSEKYHFRIVAVNQIKSLRNSKPHILIIILASLYYSFLYLFHKLTNHILTMIERHFCHIVQIFHDIAIGWNAIRETRTAT